MKIPSVEDSHLTTSSTNSVEDKLFKELYEKKLVNETFRSWYCQAFYRLGSEQVMAYAGKAMIEGRDPAKYFSYLLKRELSRME